MYRALWPPTRLARVPLLMVHRIAQVTNSQLVFFVVHVRHWFGYEKSSQIVYTSAIQGIAGDEPESMDDTMEPLFKAIMGMPKPLVREEASLQVGVAPTHKIFTHVAVAKMLLWLTRCSWTQIQNDPRIVMPWDFMQQYRALQGKATHCESMGD